MTDTAAPANETIKFPGTTGELPHAKVAHNLPQGLREFYRAISDAQKCAFEVAAPFQGQHATLDTCLGETLRYLELASMYVDRYALFVQNPHLLVKAKGPDSDG